MCHCRESRNNMRARTLLTHLGRNIIFQNGVECFVRGLKALHKYGEILVPNCASSQNYIVFSTWQASAAGRQGCKGLF